MPKSKVKVKEIKKDIKVTEIKKEESLENKVEISKNIPIFSNSSNSTNPTLAQSALPKFERNTPEKIREELRNKDKEFSYLTTVEASRSTTRSYDPSIKSNSAFFESRSSGERINPTLSSSSPLMDVQRGSGRIRDVLGQQDIEPGLRQFGDNDKDYSTEKVEKYVSKRRSE
jgi:hypothetical protein